MVSCRGFGFVPLGVGVLVSIVHSLIFLGICDVGVLQAFVFGFPLLGEIPRFAYILVHLYIFGFPLLGFV